MARVLIPRYSNRYPRAIAPKDVLVEPNVVINNAASGSASFKVYDPSRDEVLTAIEGIGQTVISVSNAGTFVIADAIELTQDDASIHASTVDSIDAAAGTVTIADITTVASAIGNRFRKIFGSKVTMTEYGTADLNKQDWGYQGLIPSTHASHADARAKDGLDVDIEIIVLGASLVEQETICTTIKEDDCA